jgi:hypothetical protein
MKSLIEAIHELPQFEALTEDQRANINRTIMLEIPTENTFQVLSKNPEKLMEDMAQLDNMYEVEKALNQLSFENQLLVIPRLHRVHLSYIVDMNAEQFVKTIANTCASYDNRMIDKIGIDNIINELKKLSSRDLAEAIFSIQDYETTYNYKSRGYHNYNQKSNTIKDTPKDSNEYKLMAYLASVFVKNKEPFRKNVIHALCSFVVEANLKKADFPLFSLRTSPVSQLKQGDLYQLDKLIKTNHITKSLPYKDIIQFTRNRTNIHMNEVNTVIQTVPLTDEDVVHILLSPENMNNLSTESCSILSKRKIKSTNKKFNDSFKYKMKTLI